MASELRITTKEIGNSDGVLVGIEGYFFNLHTGAPIGTNIRFGREEDDGYIGNGFYLDEEEEDGYYYEEEDNDGVNDMVFDNGDEFGDITEFAKSFGEDTCNDILDKLNEIIEDYEEEEEDDRGRGSRSGRGGNDRRGRSSSRNDRRGSGSSRGGRNNKRGSSRGSKRGGGSRNNRDGDRRGSRGSRNSRDDDRRGSRGSRNNRDDDRRGSRGSSRGASRGSRNDRDDDRRGSRGSNRGSNRHRDDDRRGNRRQLTQAEELVQEMLVDEPSPLLNKTDGGVTRDIQFGVMNSKNLKSGRSSVVDENLLDSADNVVLEKAMGGSTRVNTRNSRRRAKEEAIAAEVKMPSITDDAYAKHKTVSTTTASGATITTATRTPKNAVKAIEPATATTTHKQSFDDLMGIAANEEIKVDNFVITHNGGHEYLTNDGCIVDIFGRDFDKAGNPLADPGTTVPYFMDRPIEERKTILEYGKAIRSEHAKVADAQMKQDLEEEVNVVAPEPVVDTSLVERMDALEKKNAHLSTALSKHMSEHDELLTKYSDLDKIVGKEINKLYNLSKVAKAGNTDLARLLAELQESISGVRDELHEFTGKAVEEDAYVKTSEDLAEVIRTGSSITGSIEVKETSEAVHSSETIESRFSNNNWEKSTGGLSEHIIRSMKVDHFGKALKTADPVVFMESLTPAERTLGTEVQQLSYVVEEDASGIFSTVTTTFLTRELTMTDLSVYSDVEKLEIGVVTELKEGSVLFSKLEDSMVVDEVFETVTTLRIADILTQLIVNDGKLYMIREK